jgi:hypothetical protein
MGRCLVFSVFIGPGRLQLIVEGEFRSGILVLRHFRSRAWSRCSCIMSISVFVLGTPKRAFPEYKGKMSKNGNIADRW